MHWFFFFFHFLVIFFSVFCQFICIFAAKHLSFALRIFISLCSTVFSCIQIWVGSIRICCGYYFGTWLVLQLILRSFFFFWLSSIYQDFSIWSKHMFQGFLNFFGKVACLRLKPGTSRWNANFHPLRQLTFIKFSTLHVLIKKKKGFLPYMLYIVYRHINFVSIYKKKMLK